MQNLEFPIHFKFEVTTLTNDFTARDAHGNVVAFVTQNLFKLVENISVYSDDTHNKLNYQIKADRWLDWSAVYSFYDDQGVVFGKIARKGWRSIWKAEYDIIDQDDNPQYKIREENGWVKVFDALLGLIPVIGWFTGYFFNPAYLLQDTNGGTIVRLKKQPSFLGRKFEIEKIGHMDKDDDDRIMLGLMMMILLERRRG